MKKLLFMVLMVLVSTNMVKAVPQLNSFGVVSNYLQDGKIKVYDVGTLEFLATITASRSFDGSGTGSYESGQMDVVFYAVLNNVETILKTLNITSSNYSGAYLAYNETPSNPGANNMVNITLTQNLKNANIRVKYRNKDSQGNWVSYISLSTTFNTINVSPLPSKTAIYLVSYKGGSGYYNDIFQLQTSDTTPQGWYYGGIDFKAYTSSSSIERLGTVPIYQHRYEVFDINEGQAGDPKEIFFYSTSQSLTPTPLTGYSYILVSTSIAFYAFNTQVAGTIPVYRCSHKSAPIQFYKSADADIDPYAYDTLIEFYAYHPIDQ